ncbi:MAG: glycosyltransferase family 2 protein [Clostridia bacterium]|nr:glycosyltransferase family 2 protein [Clostridia bacterium]
MKIIVYFNFIISLLFMLCYFYQFVYVIVGLFKKKLSFSAEKLHRYAVVISARNESGVIGNLIESIHRQNYPSELIDIFVIADNCTDNTAQTASEAGAIVYERFNAEKIGKGYALDWLFDKIKTEHSDKNYEGYIIFDADNVVAPDFIEEMNKVFDNGYRVITSYRNSKNYDKNWITAGYSLWFLREAKFLNNARMKLKTSCAISGTGFLICADIVNKNGGWIHHLLTEDIEFTTDSIVNGEIIGYCENAVLYDEQPETFYQSYIQRLRWSKGFYQVFRKYGRRLIRGIFRGSFSCYDMFMTLMPAMLLTLISTVLNTLALPVAFIAEAEYAGILVKTLGQTMLSFYFVFFLFGFITTITEWKQIYCGAFKKIAYTFTFPIFMLTYVPISIIALFKKVKWEPIKHSVTKSIKEIYDEANTF